jgi:hypothetical protein
MPATHATHATHAAHSTHATSVVMAVAVCVVVLGLRLLGDDAVGDQQQAGHAAGVLQGAAVHLGRSDDAVLQQVAVLAGEGVEALVALGFHYLGDDDAAAFARIGGDGAQRNLQRLDDQVDAGLLVALKLRAQLAQRGNRAQVARAAAGDDALGERGAGGVERVLDAGLLLLEFGLGGGADLDLGHAAGELGEALLELLAVVVAGGGSISRRICSMRAWMALVLAGALDDGGVVGVDLDLLGHGRGGQLDLVELDAQVLHDGRWRR